MSWKEKIQPASFRGVRFGVLDAETTFGRRNVLHEYPLQDEPYSEDLGRKAREFNISAYVIGDDYMSSRDALMDAIENNKEPGTLEHPTLGIKTVIPTACRVIYKSGEGRIEYFSLSFVEAGEKKYPTSLIDTSVFANLFASESLSAYSGSFSDNFITQGLPDFLSSGALKNLESLNTLLDNLRNFGGGGLDGDFANSLDSFKSSAPVQVTEPKALGDSIVDMTSRLRTASKSPEQAIELQKRLYTYGDDFKSVPQNTTLRQIEANNQEELVGLVKNASVSQMMIASSEAEFASRQDALKVRDEIDKRASERLLVLANNFDDKPYLAMLKARNGMIRDINSRAGSLKDIRIIRVKDSMPALAQAYATYGDAKRDEELIKRNRIRNPVFIPSETDLETLV